MEDWIKELLKFYGASKKKTTYEENRRTKEEVGRELKAELDKRFKISK